MKTFYAKVGNRTFINLVHRDNNGGYESDYTSFALPGGLWVTKGQLESWALANKEEVRYWYG